MDGESEVNAEEGEVLRNFIETYEALPELWNPTNPMYLNKTKRNIALDILLNIYVKVKPGASRADVRRKINTLRCNYRKELKKIVSSKRSGSSTDEVYQPTSWVFYALQFLDKFEQPVNANVRQVDEDTHDGTDSEVHGEQFSTPAAPTASRSSILPPPPPPKKRRLLGPIAKQNELLQKACSYLDQPREPQENIPTIAKAWGEKLNTLDPQQRALAEKAISDILFEASQGTLHRYSVKINEDPMYGTVSSLTSFPITVRNPSLQSFSSVDTSSSPSPAEEQENTLPTLFANFKA